MSWFDTARFGLFIHWSHSSQKGLEVSWPLVGGIPPVLDCGDVPVDEYHSTAATFDPQSWDAGSLARRARDLGMQYAVLTTKHHDGYAMFHTKQSSGSQPPFSIEQSPFGRDIVREYADAMREEGIRVGFYFSLIDWHHPDYPAFTEADKPYTFGKWRQPESPQAWERYIDFMFAQVRELLTDYSQIDVIWFDGHWERTPEQWKAQELEEMVRSLQPEILINDRLPGAGDFETPEQFVPPQPLEGPWETCMTIGKLWGYDPRDTDRKSARQLIHTLCEVAGRGGNLLLNVGPMGDGSLPPAIIERLDEIERWMSANKEAVVGTQAGLEPWQFYGPSTRSGDRVYLHLLMRPYESVSVRGVHVKRLRSVRALSTGEALTFDTRTAIVDLVNPDPLGEVTIQVPEKVIDPSATVLALEFAEQPFAN
ncbi:MAG: alpha-L-fucosidase [Chloroflexi bacterium]|nr:alpha-L-fucosidase [Chloroflexota bacterium]